MIKDWTHNMLQENDGSVRVILRVTFKLIFYWQRQGHRESLESNILSAVFPIKIGKASKARWRTDEIDMIIRGWSIFSAIFV